MGLIGRKGAIPFGDIAAQAVSQRFYGAVDAETDLDTISPDDRVDGMVAAVMADRSVWVFDGDSSTAELAGSVRQPATGDGRWHIATAGASALAGGLTKKTVTVGHADLTAAATSQAINIGTALPANARIKGVAVKLTTPFSGGGAAAVSVDIGSTGDVDAIIDGSDLFAAAVDGQASTHPLGIAPNKHFVASTQLLATFIADVNVADLTAGSVTIDVLYAVLA